jgi:hypothetical protein
MTNFCVAYITGGTENAKWNFTIDFATEAEANECLEKVKRQGYFCIVTTRSAFLSINAKIADPCVLQAKHFERRRLKYGAK